MCYSRGEEEAQEEEEEENKKKEAELFKKNVDEFMSVFVWCFHCSPLIRFNQ